MRKKSYSIVSYKSPYMRRELSPIHVLKRMVTYENYYFNSKLSVQVENILDNLVRIACKTGNMCIGLCTGYYCFFISYNFVRFEIIYRAHTYEINYLKKIPDNNKSMLLKVRNHVVCYFEIIYENVL